MFKIGDFARIARVTGRQLRHYDDLGLLRPGHVDQATGYRYYSADQLPRLNRILALKDLGFSLDEIARLISERVGVEELRGMLVMRRSQIEQALAGEQDKLRNIESRIAQIEEQGAIRDYDVTLKAVPAWPFLSVRRTFPGMGEAVAMLQAVIGTVRRRVRREARERFTVIAHTDFDDADLDLELGVTLTDPINREVILETGAAMTLRELEPVDEMASIVRAGPVWESHRAYGALGVWMQANGYDIAGPCREVFLETPFSPPANENVVMEIQFPVRRRSGP